MIVILTSGETRPRFYLMKALTVTPGGLPHNRCKGLIVINKLQSLVSPTLQRKTFNMTATVRPW
jgi:hypothetical protein